AVLVDAIIEKIPGVNRIKFSADDIQRKFGPFGEPVTVGFFVAMAVAVHRGNLFRTLISGVIIMSITLWIATQT
ncbi:hypothetical protein UY844_24930, partial [Escherichia coli]|nr:hypothetical protein [Escherichia coli]